MPSTQTSVEIRPGTISQVIEGRQGQKILVNDDVQGIATQLQEINDQLRLVYLPHAGAGLWTVEQHIPMPDGSVKEELVTTAEDLDHRLLQRVREVTAPGYDLAGEIERLERQADREHESRRRETAGDMAEKLGFALRKDLGRHEAHNTLKSRAFIPAFKPKD